MSKTRQNYNGRKFVWLDEVKYKDSYMHEHEFLRNYFAFRSFTYKECIDMMIKVMKLRDNYLTKSGKDHTRLESGHRFKTLLNVGMIAEIKS